jgi:hypothetical protein
MKKSTRVFMISTIAASSFLFSTPANAAVNDLATIAAADAVALITAGSTSIVVIPGSEVSYGSMKSFTSVDLSPGFDMPQPGIFLNSDSASNVFGSNNRAESDSANGSGIIRSQLDTILSNAGATGHFGSLATTTNVSSLSFDFTTTDSSVVSLEIDFMFASMEIFNSNWDVAAVIVDGVNYAFLPNATIMRVRPEANLCNFQPNNYGGNQNPDPSCQNINSNLDYNNYYYYNNQTLTTLNGIVAAAAPSSRIGALLNPLLSTHSITFAVADTSDQIVPSYLMFSLVQGSIQTFSGLGGIILNVEPNAPTSVVAISTGSTTADVSFTAPDSDGGATITSYTATSSPGGISGTVEQSGSGVIPMSGLQPGTAYTFTVVATNSIGDSLPSTTSNSITTIGVPSTPSSVVAKKTGKRSAQVTLTNSAYDGGSAIISYTITSNPGGLTKTFTLSGPQTINYEFLNLQPDTVYTFAATATNATGTSAAKNSNSIKTDALIVASLSSLTFTEDGTGTGGKIVWAGTSIDAVLYTGPAASYPGPYNYGAFSSGWNGRIRNLTPGTEYTVSIFAISSDGVGESKSLTFKTSATLPALAGASSSTTSQADQMTTQLPKLFAWIDENVFVPGEGDRMKTMFEKFDAANVLARSAYLKLPNSSVVRVSSTSSTPLVCMVEGPLTVHSIAAGTCTISYTVSGHSKAPVTMVKDFVFKKFG